MNLKTKILKKMKQYLTRSVVLYQMYENDEYIYCFLELRHFWRFKREIKVQYKKDKQIHTLPFSIDKNILTVKVPKQNLLTDKVKFVIRLYINNELMWVTLAPGFRKDNEGLIIGGYYFNIGVNKNIIIRKQYMEFDFAKEKINASVLDATHNSLALQLDKAAFCADNSMQLYAFYKNKFQKIDVICEGGRQVVAEDFSSLPQGSCRLFIGNDQQLYRLGLVEDFTTVFNTLYHQVKIYEKQGNFHLHLKEHKLECPLVAIEEANWNKIKLNIKIPDLERNRERLLLVRDTKFDIGYRIQIYEEDNRISALIPIEVLTEHFTRKKFSIIDNNEQPVQYQFDLRRAALEGSAVTSVKISDSQHISCMFYKRKDHSLGFKATRPILEKLITSISDFKVSGYRSSLEEFENCAAYLVIEERESQETIEVSINEYFEVDLGQFDLMGLKSKDKTLMDLFVEIRNHTGEVIRKAKIKYEHADYRKDNYYDYKVIHDEKDNQHHFLVTTTPFDNVKLEVFEISHHITVPADTSRKDKNIWLLGERYNTAQDNGFVLFQWLRKNTAVDAYYVIEANASDYEEVKDDPHVLAFGSQKHFDIAWKAKVLLGTHDLENLLPYKPAKGFFHYEDTYKVFLQHGVLGRKNVEYHKKYYEQPFDLFLVSSDPEKYDVVMKQLGYDAEEVAVTGLARFDKLPLENKSRDILLMPTWRDWINTDEKFLTSQYYTAYTSLVNNPKLLEVLERYNVNLNFYPHYRAQTYFNEDMITQSEQIRFISLGTKSVQQLLIDHALLITDYSSVSFDFSLMNKPVIYYHFDVKRFFRMGILRPVEETFIGRISHAEEELVALIEERIANAFENYDVDTTGIIKYQDHHNCERIYRTVCDML